MAKSDVTFFPITEKLHESSGLILWDNLLWSHNDDTDTQLYGLNPKTGALEKEFKIDGLKVTDWEELQHDKNHLYLGDFGNNYKGNRKNLRILKIQKSTHKIEEITFHFPEQTNLEVQKSNTTDFDCEAFLVSDSVIYLFTKEWSSGNTALYKLPNKPGLHKAIKIKELAISGLITGATFNSSRSTIVLSGYTKTLSPFLILLENFTSDNFFDCKITKLRLPKTFLQIEAVTFIDDQTIALTNEAFKHAVINSSQQLGIVNVQPYLSK